MDTGLQLIVFGLVLDEIQAGEIAPMQDDRLPAGTGTEGQDDPAAGVGLVVQPAKPKGDIRHRSVGIVHDGDHLSGRAGGDQRP